MKNRNYVLAAAMVVAVLCSSVSAYTLNTEQSTSDRLSLAETIDLLGGDSTTDFTLEIGAGGGFTANNRFDHDGPYTLTLNGGYFTQVNGSRSDYKLPDNNTGNPARVHIINGTMTLESMQCNPDRDAFFTIYAGGKLVVQNGYTETFDPDDTTNPTQYNVAWLIGRNGDPGIVASYGCNLVVTELEPAGAVQVTAEPNETVALDPSPENGADGVPVDTDLSWTSATCMTSQDIWFTTDPNLASDPNFYFSTPHPEALIASGIAETTVTNDLLNGGDPLESLTTYYWMVASAGGGGDPCVCPAVYDKIGIPWTFTTILLAANITSQPESEVVPAGVEAVFVVEADQTDLIEWYKVGEPDVLLATSGDITIEPIDVDGIGTLRITNPESNEGEYYCVVSNSLPSDLESEHVYLYIEKLLAHWKFEDLTCEVDSANDGSASPLAASYVSSVAPAAGNAVDLSTAIDPNQIVRVVDSAIGALPKVTVSFWMKANIVEGGGVNTSLIRADGVAGSNVSGSVNIRLNSGNIEFRVQSVNTVRDAEPEPDVWYHYVGTYDGVDEYRMRVYINGELEITEYPNERGEEALAHIQSLTIGGWYDEAGVIEDNFDGQIDDVRIYNYELTGLEVASLYTDWVDTTICLGLSEAAQAVDIVQDCEINLADFAALAAQWMECQMVPYCEFDLP